MAFRPGEVNLAYLLWEGKMSNTLEAVKALCVEFEFNTIGKRLFGEAFNSGRGYVPPASQAAQPIDAESPEELALTTEAEPEKRWAGLAAAIAERRVTDIVLGYPLNMDDTAGPKAREAEAFAAKLRGAFSLPVHLIDERLTSYEAESTIARHRRREVRASGLVDSRAATLILQDFLDQRVPPPPSPEESS